MNGGAEAVSKTPNRDKFNARMKSKYPDREFADDEELFGQIESDYEGAEENASTISALNDMIGGDERAASFLSSWHRGGDPLLALVEEYGEEFVQGLTLPENKEKVAEASKKYLKKIADSKALDEEIAKNDEASQQVLDALREEYGEEKVDAAISSLGDKLKNWLMHKITKEDVLAEINAANYDADVQKASEEGEVRGRNANIVAKKRMAKAGDGMPNIGGGVNKPVPKSEGKDYGALSKTANTASIWDR